MALARKILNYLSKSKAGIIRPFFMQRNVYICQMTTDEFIIELRKRIAGKLISVQIFTDYRKGLLKKVKH